MAVLSNCGPTHRPSVRPQYLLEPSDPLKCQEMVLAPCLHRVQIMFVSVTGSIPWLDLSRCASYSGSDFYDKALGRINAGFRYTEPFLVIRNAAESSRKAAFIAVFSQFAHKIGRPNFPLEIQTSRRFRAENPTPQRARKGRGRWEKKIHANKGLV